MSNEIVVGSAIISGSEVLIASLAAWHPYVDVYVDATVAPSALGSEWRLYAITAGTRTLVATGIYNPTDPTRGQRVLSAIPAVGTTMQLWAETNLGPTAGPVKGAIVGWDPSLITPNPTDTADATVALVPGPSTNVLALPWHPTVTILIQAPAVARGSSWFINAVIPGFGVNVPVAGALYEDVSPARVTCVGGGGAASWVISGSAPAGPTGNVKIAAFGDTGPPFTFVTPSPAFPTTDAIFEIDNAADATKVLRSNLAGQAPGTTTTLTTTALVSRPFRLPNISGTAVVQEDATGFVFLGSDVPLHGSNSGVQLSSLVSNRAQFRGNQYGANTGAPGISTFKSRGVTVGSLAGIVAGDALFRATCVGVAPDNVSIPLAGFITIQVPAAFVPAGQAFAPSEYELQLVPLAGPINSRRVVFKVSSEGETQTLRGVRAGGPATAPGALTTGTLWSSGAGAPEGVITGSPGDLYSSTSGAGAPASYVKATGVATNAGWRSLDLVYGTPAGVAVVNANETDLTGNAQVPAFSSVWSFTAAGGAAQATAFSAPAIAVASAHKVHVSVTASDTAGAECASWDFDVLFRFTGGVLTIQGAVPNAAGVAPGNASAGAAGWLATVDFAGAVPRVRVTGDGAATTRFAGVYQTIPVVAP